MCEQTAPGHPDRTESSGDEAEAADRLRRGSSFGAAAAAYAEHRPGYAEAAVRWAVDPVRDRRPVPENPVLSSTVPPNAVPMLSRTASLSGSYGATGWPASHAAPRAYSASTPGPRSPGMSGLTG